MNVSDVVVVDDDEKMLNMMNCGQVLCHTFNKKNVDSSNNNLNLFYMSFNKREKAKKKKINNDESFRELNACA